MFIQNILHHSAGEILANRLIKQVFESVLLSASQDAGEGYHLLSLAVLLAVAKSKTE